ncbi:tetratricopeptide repeat protein [Balneolaceae bacterium ANBcel3]|nr:tetratricopeptide repeat protein [Balneolaceae bacterium ANBcel3]
MNTERIQALNKFLEENPEDSFCRFALALEYLSSGDVHRARSFFEFIVQHDPAYTGVYYHLGKLYESEGLTQKALEIYQRGLDIAHKNQDLHLANELKDAISEWSINHDT